MLKTLALSIWIIFHPVHASFTSIDFVPGTDSVRVFFRMYFDDFLRDYQTTDDDRDLSKIFGENSLPADLINNYFNSKVFIYVNNKLITGKLLTVDLKDNELSLNLYFRSEKKLKKITVKNMVLTGWFSDQENMIIVRAKEIEEGFKLTPEHFEETFILK
jgi:hypothetical protein